MIMIRTSILSTVIIYFLSGISFAETGEWSNKDWSVEKQGGRVFYTTHGQAVWGHRFGFVKTVGACAGDMLWVEFSSDTKKVDQFQGKIITFNIDVDGMTTEVKAPMAFVAPLDASELTIVMTFTNIEASSELIRMVTKGHKAALKIVAPKELMKFLDVKQDSFSLEGFLASRVMAKEFCDVGIKGR